MFLALAFEREQERLRQAAEATSNTTCNLQRVCRRKYCSLAIHVLVKSASANSRLFLPEIKCAPLARVDETTKKLALQAAGQLTAVKLRQQRPWSLAPCARTCSWRSWRLPRRRRLCACCCAGPRSSRGALAPRPARAGTQTTTSQVLPPHQPWRGTPARPLIVSSAGCLQRMERPVTSRSA